MSVYPFDDDRDYKKKISYYLKIKIYFDVVYYSNLTSFSLIIFLW